MLHGCDPAVHSLYSSGSCPLCCSLLLALPARRRAPTHPAPPHYRDREAEIRVAPDEVTMTLGVETNDPDLAVAARKNSEQLRQVLAMAKEFKTYALSLNNRTVRYQFSQIPVLPLCSNEASEL